MTSVVSATVFDFPAPLGEAVMPSPDARAIAPRPHGQIVVGLQPGTQPRPPRHTGAYVADMEPGIDAMRCWLFLRACRPISASS